MQLPNTLPRPSQSRLNLPPIGSSYMPSTMLPGYYVNSDDDISARDVPNDGSISFFPAKDLSHIVIKQWNGNALESAVYVLRGSQQSQPVQQGQQTSTLPAPPPPVQQQQTQTQPQQPQQQTQMAESFDALLQGFRQMNEGMANAVGQLGESITSIRESMEAITRKLENGSGVG